MFVEEYTGSNGHIAMRGSISDINAALNGLVFLPDVDYSGGANITITVNDLGNSGSGGPYGIQQTIPLWVYAYNDAPVLTVPGARYTGQNTDLYIPGISVSDSDAATSTMRITLGVDHGVLTLPTFPAMSHITLNMSLAGLNTVLEGLAYTPDRISTGRTP